MTTPSDAVSLPIIVGVYGTVHPHPWASRDSLEVDAYALFGAHAAAMGWNSEPGGLAPDPWGMNEAEQDWFGTARPRLVSWVQVAPADLSATRPLPLQPVVACAGQALSRVGELDLDALQVQVPGQPPGRGRRGWRRATHAPARSLLAPMAAELRVPG